jgi:N-acetylglucosamine kinase-like BadF-type ATPase
MAEPIAGSGPAQSGSPERAAAIRLSQAALIAGFDAGQTHTTCRLAEAHSGRVLAEGEGPGVSHLAAAAGEERFRQALIGSLHDALRRLDGGGVAPEPSPLPAGTRDPEAPGEQRSSPGMGAPAGGPALLAAAVGASGIERDSAVERRGLALAAEALALEPERLWVGGDERTALRGAFPEGAGIIVISGTGTIALGRDGHGREHRCAGWGWILDGAGSAFDIGRDGLALSLEMADGRRPEGSLLPRLWRALGLDPADPGAPQAIKARVVSAGFVPAALAALAPLVEEAAAAGDGDALTILRRHGEALAVSVAAVARALDLVAPPVAALGGAIRHLPVFRRQFEQALAERLPGACLGAPAGDAASGALAIARGLAEAVASGG